MVSLLNFFMFGLNINQIGLLFLRTFYFLSKNSKICVWVKKVLRKKYRGSLMSLALSLSLGLHLTLFDYTIQKIQLPNIVFLLHFTQTQESSPWVWDTFKVNWQESKRIHKLYNFFLKRQEFCLWFLNS